SSTVRTEPHVPRTDGVTAGCGTVDTAPGCPTSTTPTLSAAARGATINPATNAETSTTDARIAQASRTESRGSIRFHTIATAPGEQDRTCARGTAQREPGAQRGERGAMGAPVPRADAADRGARHPVAAARLALRPGAVAGGRRGPELGDLARVRPR